jgi:hypothetical protein
MGNQMATQFSTTIFLGGGSGGYLIIPLRVYDRENQVVN